MAESHKQKKRKDDFLMQGAILRDCRSHHENHWCCI